MCIRDSIRDILTEDYNHVSLLSLAGVALVVFLTFRSVLVPILVIVPIEVAIYLNMTLPYVMGDTMIYIGYIIVSCLQPVSYTHLDWRTGQAYWLPLQHSEVLYRRRNASV